MLVGDLARTEGGGRWATFAAPPQSSVHDNGGSRLRQPTPVRFGEAGWSRRPSLEVSWDSHLA